MRPYMAIELMRSRIYAENSPCNIKGLAARDYTLAIRRSLSIRPNFDACQRLISTNSFNNPRSGTNKLVEVLGTRHLGRYSDTH